MRRNKELEQLEVQRKLWAEQRGPGHEPCPPSRIHERGPIRPLLFGLRARLPLTALFAGLDGAAANGDYPAAGRGFPALGVQDQDELAFRHGSRF